MVAERKRLSALEMALYGGGHVSVSVVTAVTMAWVVRFYDYEGYAPLGLIGLALIVGRVVDAVADPLVGHWSDRSRAKMGRRSAFIFWGAPAIAVTFLLMWTPPLHRVSLVNVLYLAFMGSAFFFAFTVGVCPYLAMLPELAPGGRERATLAAVQAAFNAVGLVAAVFAGVLIQRHGYVRMGLVYAAVAWATMWLPLAGRREPREGGETEAFGIAQAVRATLRNRPFWVYVRAYLFFWLGLQALMVALPYYVDVVLGMKESGFTLLQGASVGTALLLFWLLPWATARWGRKRLLLAGFLDMAVAVPMLSVAGVLPQEWRLTVALVGIVLAAPAVAIVFGVPNAVVADLCDHDAAITGRRREGMYFGVQGFMVKLVMGGGALAASLILHWLGDSVARPWGVLAVPLFCALCAVAALLSFRAYDLELAPPGLGVEPARE